jgi:phage gp46-like protein
MYAMSEPRLYLGENGADMRFVGGEPVANPLATAVLMSLFTKSWAGNGLFLDIDVHIGSDYEEKCAQPITLSALNDIRQAAERALKWMRDKKLAKIIHVQTRNPSAHRILTEIDIDGMRVTIEKSGSQWTVTTGDEN